jgi:uncharacterized coiled-coil DUF342 family protein
LSIAAQLGKALIEFNNSLSTEYQDLRDSHERFITERDQELSAPLLSPISSTAANKLFKVQYGGRRTSELTQYLHNLEEMNDSLNAKVDFLNHQIDDERKRNYRQVSKLEAQISSMEEELALAHLKVEEIRALRGSGTSLRESTLGEISIDGSKGHKPKEHVDELQLYILTLEENLSELHEKYTSLLEKLVSSREENKDLQNKLQTIQDIVHSYSKLKDEYHAQRKEIAELKDDLIQLQEKREYSHCSHKESVEFDFHYSEMHSFGWNESPTLFEEFEKVDHALQEQKSFTASPSLLNELSESIDEDLLSPISPTTSLLSSALSWPNPSIKGHNRFDICRIDQVLNFVQFWVKFIYFFVIYIYLGLFEVVYEKLMGQKSHKLLKQD